MQAYVWLSERPTVQVFAGAAGGFAVGLILNSAGAYGCLSGAYAKQHGVACGLAELAAFPGDCFIASLTCLVLPFVASSMFCGAGPPRIGAAAQAAKPAGAAMMAKRALMFYTSTTAVAACEALLFSAVFSAGYSPIKFVGGGEFAASTQFRGGGGGGKGCVSGGGAASFGRLALLPCNGSDASQLFSMVDQSPMPEITMLQTLLSIGHQLIPKNIVAAFANSKLLGMIVFFVALGGAAKAEAEERSQDSSDGEHDSVVRGCVALYEMVDALQNVLLRLIKMIIAWCPLGIASLIAGSVARSASFVTTMAAVGFFVFAVFLAEAFHVAVTLASLIRFLTGRSPYVYFWNARPALATAFGTASSAATLPVSLQTAKEANGIEPEVANFVFPLGATVNMDGSAIYLCMASVFVAALRGNPLPLGQQVSVAITACMLSCGAAPIPSAGPVFLYLVLDSAGLKRDPQLDQIVMMIYTVDWLLDRIRTAVNVSGDHSCACVVNHFSATRQVTNGGDDGFSSMADEGLSEDIAPPR